MLPAHYGIEKNSGNLTRDLADQKRIMLIRGEPQRIRTLNAKERVLRFVVCTEGVKRDGHKVRIGDLNKGDTYGFDFTNFAKNPVALWTHDYGSEGRPPLMPVGNWRNWEVELGDDGRRQLVADLKFASHAMANDLYQLYLPEEDGGDGCGHACSIGWVPLTWDEMRSQTGAYIGHDFLTGEMLEISPCGIPADPDAVLKKLSRAMNAGRISSETVERLADWGQLPKKLRGYAYVLSHQEPARSEAVVPPTEGSDSDDLARALAAALDESPNGNTPEKSPSADTGVSFDELGRACGLAAELRAVDHGVFWTEVCRSIALSFGTVARGQLSDAMDSARDRACALHSQLYGVLDQLSWEVTSLFIKGRDMVGLEAAPAYPTDEDWARRCVKRGAALASQLADAFAEMEDIMAGEEPTGDLETASSEAPVTRKGMKVAAKRLEKLLSCRTCFADGVRALDDVILEGEAERKKEEEAEPEDEDQDADETDEDEGDKEPTESDEDDEEDEDEQTMSLELGDVIERATTTIRGETTVELDVEIDDDRLARFAKSLGRGGIKSPVKDDEPIGTRADFADILLSIDRVAGKLRTGRSVGGGE